MPLIPLIIALTFASVVLFLGLSIRRKRATLYRWDLTTLRSVVTFKPRLGHSFTQREAELLELLHRQLQAQGATLDGLFHEPAQQRVVFGLGGQDYQLTLMRLEKYPEEWALRVDQKFSHGVSAPHDTPATRQMFSLLQELLYRLPVGTVRWHKRQDWERGQIDVWSYHPC